MNETKSEPEPVADELGESLTPLLNGVGRSLNGIEHSADEGEAQLQRLVHDLLHAPILWQLLFLQLQELEGRGEK